MTGFNVLFEAEILQYPFIQRAISNILSEYKDYLIYETAFTWVHIISQW